MSVLRLRLGATRRVGYLVPDLGEMVARSRLRRFRRRPRTLEAAPMHERRPRAAVADHLRDQEPVARAGREPLDRLAATVRRHPPEHANERTFVDGGRQVVEVDADDPDPLDTPTPPGGILRVWVHPED